MYFKRNRTTTDMLTGVLVTVLIITITAGVFLAVKRFSDPAGEAAVSSSDPTASPTVNSLSETYGFSEEELIGIRSEYEEACALNDDVRAVLVFASGLIHQVVVQGDDNTAYLKKDWQSGEETHAGSIFLDYKAVFSSSQNLTLFGHYAYESVYADRTIMFTPLAVLREEDSYEENRYLALVTETEVRYYVITDVADIELDGEYPPADMDWMKQDYDETYLDNYIRLLKEIEYYDTSLRITGNDRFITMQTCVEDDSRSRLVVLAREEGRRSFD